MGPVPIRTIEKSKTEIESEAAYPVGVRSLWQETCSTQDSRDAKVPIVLVISFARLHLAATIITISLQHESILSALHCRSQGIYSPVFSRRSSMASIYQTVFAGILRSRHPPKEFFDCYLPLTGCKHMVSHSRLHGTMSTCLRTHEDYPECEFRKTRHHSLDYRRIEKYNNNSYVLTYLLTYFFRPSIS